MPYTEVTVIVNGAVDQAETCQNPRSVARICNEVASWAHDHPDLPVQIFLLHHEHALSTEECSCIQYLSDYGPTMSFNDA